MRRSPNDENTIPVNSQDFLRMLQLSRVAPGDYASTIKSYHEGEAIDFGGKLYVNKMVDTVSSGQKFDSSKPRYDLLDTGFLDETAKVLSFGAEKYAAHNWRKGISYSRLIAAALRHLTAINAGEDRDPESGLLHTGHLGCCIQFLDWMIKHRPDLDDRWKAPETSISQPKGDSNEVGFNPLNHEQSK